VKETEYFQSMVNGKIRAWSEWVDLWIDGENLSAQINQYWPKLTDWINELKLIEVRNGTKPWPDYEIQQPEC
jgi:hypothetical protein